MKKKKSTKSEIILPNDSGIILPGKKVKKEETISTMIQIPFVFRTGEKMEDIVDRLDLVFTDERNKTLGAIGKLLGIKVNFEN